MFKYFKVISTLIFLAFSGSLFAMEPLSDKELGKYVGSFGLDIINQEQLDVGETIEGIFSDNLFGRLLSFDNVDIGNIHYGNNSSYISISVNGSIERRISLPSRIDYLAFENVRLGEGKPIGDIYFTNIRIY